MTIKYDINTFTDNFKKIIKDSFGAEATDAHYVIIPAYDPKKSETGEDSVFRLVVLAEDNIGGKELSFSDTVSILTSFEFHYPTKIIISPKTSEINDVFEIICSTRVRKPSEISNIENQYAPFEIKHQLH